MAEQHECRRSTPATSVLAWWALAVGLAAALKVHFSAAAASDLHWILDPLALLLRLFTGWRFEQNAADEWYSLDAGIVLVKACAGINFMILSFIGWCWLSRPRGRLSLRHATIEWPVLLGSALVFAWIVALLVNALRVLAIVHWQPTLEHWLPSGDAHRLLGIVVYLAALKLQFLLFEPRRWPLALILACGLYCFLMLVVPLLTGNALADPVQYARHVVISLIVLLPPMTLGLTRYWRTREHENLRTWKP